MTVVSPFFDIIPPEIRLKIYGLLLINDDLANISMVWENKLGESAKYDLEPAILRTCRQIYLEAVDVLYTKNTFAIDCTGNLYDELGVAFPSSLTRFTHRSNYNMPWAPKQEDAFKKIRAIPAFSKILHWKVTVEDAVLSWREHERHSGISAFCKAVCHTPLNLLKICMHCKDCAESHFVETAMNRGNFGPIVGPMWRGTNTTSYFDILEPLQMLRNVKKLEFECAKCQGKSNLLSEDEEMFIQASIHGDSSPNLLFEQYEGLLTYCKTFERWEPYRREMGNYPRFRNALKFDPEKFNPYQYDHTHPVESHLLLARQATDDDNHKLFDSERKIILEYLEPQYQRISKLMDRLVEVVKAEKVTRGILGDALYGDFSQIDRVEVHILLEDLAAAFTRDVTPRIRALMRAYNSIMDQTYSTLDRERCLEAMNTSLDVDDYVQQRPNRLNVPVRENRHREWQYYFRLAGADMDRQWLDIRKARRELFKYDADGATKGCDIDVEEWRYDDAIVWDVMEPTWFGPLKEGSERLPFVEHEAWAIGGWGSEHIAAEGDCDAEDMDAGDIEGPAVGGTGWDIDSHSRQN